jgi:ubiquinone/menaquinone biosynthesis C-methylase UbiE
VRKSAANQDERKYVPALGYAWLTALYDPVVRITTRETTFKKELLTLAELDADARLLDLGCGTATFAMMAKTAQPGTTVVGLDADAQVLEKGRTKTRAARVEVDLVRGLGDRLPFPDRSFDRVVSSLFFHHLDLEAKGRVSAEIFRVLSPGGELHVADWGVPTNPVMRALFLSIQILDGFANTTDNVRGLLPSVFEASGFENVSTQGNLSTVFGTLSYVAGHKPL